MHEKWEVAHDSWASSIKVFPLNTTSYYLEGCYYQEQKMYKLAAECHLKSILLDPDFKSPYIALGNAYLLAERFQQAMEACTASFRRHPDSPGGMFNLGQAIYHRMRRGDKMENMLELFEQAKEALDLAKRRMPEQWTEADELMLKYFNVSPGARNGVPKQQVHVWKVYGWRP